MPAPANEQQVFLQPSESGVGILRVLSFTGNEEVSHPFEFEISTVSDNRQIDFSKIVNKPAQLIRMRGGEKVVQYGLINRFEQSDSGADRVEYRAFLVPRVWKLSLNFESRIFQNKSVEEIISEVLKGLGFSAGGDFKFELNGVYAARDYCVQYRESDLDFISRLMEFEGMSYFFDHEGGSDVMVITDHSGGHPMMSGESTLIHRASGGLHVESEVVHDFVYREEIVTGAVLLKDYNYETPETDIKSESSINTAMVGRLYDYGGNIKDSDQADRLAIVRNQEIECRRKVFSGVTDCAGMRSGNKFSLSEHYRRELNQDYLIVNVKHTFDSEERDNASNADYSAEFGCIPSSVQFRPLRTTPIPQITGVMTAKLETAGGDYAYIDHAGRYKAKMPFDIGSLTDGTATKALRMAQPYAGAGYGIHFPNHAATEVIWACIDGDVDRPIIVGSVPNPSTTSPSTSANKAQNVIRTWGDNELTFDDTKGDENIHMIATKNHTVNVASNEAVSIGNNQTHSVGKDRTRDVGKNETVTIGETQSINVGVDQSVTVEKNRTTKVGVDDSTTVGGEFSLEVGKNASIIVAGDIEILGGKNTKIKTNDDLKLEAGKKAVFEIADQLTIICGTASVTMKKNGDIVLSGKQIDLKTSGDVKIKAAGDIGLKGVNINIEASGALVMKGNATDVEATGQLTLKGAMITAN